MAESSYLTGSLKSFLLFDIAEAIDLPALHNILGTSPRRREPAFRHPAPEYVRFERPPVEEEVGAREIRPESIVNVRIRYFDYGVASVEMDMPFLATWDALVHLAHRWITEPDVERAANSFLKDSLGRSAPALKKQYENWITEDYYVVQLDPLLDAQKEVVSAETLLHEHGPEIAQIVRGEDRPLSTSERKEVLQSSMSYHPSDLLVLAWVAAFVYDTRVDAEPTIDLLEYANTQLLEFRYYDDVLTDVLADVYDRLEQKHTMWARWKLASQAESLNTIRLDYQELAERTDNAIKFLSDMFYARAYRLAAARIGVTDYRNLVTAKLDTARDLYTSMVNEFHQGRAFFLEAMVVIILIIEIVFLFRGKP